MNNYQSLDKVVTDFHKEFYASNSKILKLYNFLSILTFLVLSLVAFGFHFSLVLALSYNSFMKLGFNVLGYTDIIFLAKYFFTMIFLTSVCLAWYVTIKNKIQKKYHIKNKRYNKEYLGSIDSKKIEETTERELKILWIKSKFEPKNLNSVIELFDKYSKYVDDLDQVLNIRSFLSSFFAKGFFAVLITGGMNFIVTYHANKLSQDSGIDILGLSLYQNIIVIVVLILAILLLVYFYYFIIKDMVIEFLDFFISSKKITNLRKKD